MVMLGIFASVKIHITVWYKENTNFNYESESEVAQSCPTLWDPVYCSLPGSSLYGILQARILEWVAISFSRGSSQPRNRTRVSCGSCSAGWFFTAEPPGKLEFIFNQIQIWPRFRYWNSLLAHSSQSSNMASLQILPWHLSGWKLFTNFWFNSIFFDCTGSSLQHASVL